MKIRNILAAAGLAVAALGASSGATAQNYNGGDRHYDRDDRDHRSDRRDDRRDDRRYDRYDRHSDRGRHYGYDRGRHYGWDRHHQRCWVEWRHHRRVRICR